MSFEVSRELYLEIEGILKRRIMDIITLYMVKSMSNRAPGDPIKIDAKSMIMLYAETYALYYDCSFVPSLECSSRRVALAMIAENIKSHMFERYKELGTSFFNLVKMYSYTEEYIEEMISEETQLQYLPQLDVGPCVQPTDLDSGELIVLNSIEELHKFIEMQKNKSLELGQITQQNVHMNLDKMDKLKMDAAKNA